MIDVEYSLSWDFSVIWIISTEEGCYSCNKLLGSVCCAWVLSSSSSQSSLFFFINVPFRMSCPVSLPAYQRLTVDQRVCLEVSHNVSALDGCDSWVSRRVARPWDPTAGAIRPVCQLLLLAPIGVTMLHLACESSRGTETWRWLLLWARVKGGGDKLYLQL